MRLATFVANGRTAVGAVLPNATHLLDLTAGADPAAGCFANMLALLGAGPPGMAAASALVRAAIDGPGDKHVLPLAGVRLTAPIMYPPNLFALAGNYREHIEEGGGKMAPQDRQTPRIFMKPASTTVIGPGEPIRIPPVARAIDWEGELAVVIGRRAKGVEASSALEYVAGYTILNDVSERQLQIRPRTESRPRDRFFDWLNGKWFDTSAPMGPWIVTADEIPDPHDLQISTHVNGERRQYCGTGQMIFPVGDVIEYLSAFVTLQPGDVISTGTVAGVGVASSTFLAPGDTVKVGITGIGELENPVVASEV